MVHQSAGIPSADAPDIGRVVLGDIQVAFRRSGQGTPVVFVHGLGQDHRSWDPVIDRLAPGVNAYVPDLRGHGSTSIGQASGTASQLAGDLLAFLRTVSGPAICVGFSLGGVIVLGAALQDPALVRQAIVVGTSSKVGRAAVDYFSQRVDQAQNDVDAFQKALASDTDAMIVHARDQVDDTVRQRLAAVGDAQGFANAARAMIALADAPMTESLRNIKVPVHIIQGLKDMFCPPKAAEILRQAMPQATYAEIPDTGHLMSVDQPERLAQAISRAVGTDRQ